MKLFSKYVYQHRFSIAIILIFTVIICQVNYLYNLHAESCIYSMILCGIAGSVALIIGFIRFRRKHIQLMEILDNLPVLSSSLPSPDNTIEKDYSDIIAALNRLNLESRNTIKAVHNSSIDYYTVWVHQIKTPIAAMQMLLQSEDTPANKDLSAELFRIEQYAEMALQYIRLDSDSTDFVFKEYDLDAIIRKAVRRYAPQFVHRKIKLLYSPVQSKVLTDEKWLLFIIEQLLSNAIKYTAPGGTVTIGYQDGVLYVKDTGIGISKEDIPRIFEKGYTGISGRSDNKSTGLGLYLCKRTADNLGYELNAESEVGSGSTFSVNLMKDKLDIE